MSSGIKRLVLDVLKPHEPHLPELAARLSRLKGVDGVNISLEEIDQSTESIKITMEGSNIDFEEVAKCLTENGAVIHSVDEVAVGKRLVEKVKTESE